MSDHEARKQWLQDLKAGDEVATRNQGHYRFAVVERVTATQLVVDGDRYRKSDGRNIGGSRHGGSRWDTWSLEIPEQARQAIAKREARKSAEEKRRDALRRITRRIEAMTLEQLLALEEVMSPKEGE